MKYSFAVIAAVVLGLLKVYKPNVFVHNFTEVFIYTGLTIIFLPILNLTSAIVLLVLISIYDMIAVWKSKHMITLAKFQTESKVFAGLFIPYKKQEKMPVMSSISPSTKTANKIAKGKTTKAKSVPSEMPLEKEKMRNAILGGGDIAFPLLFASAVMEHLILEDNVAKAQALGLSGIIAITSALALFILLVKAKEDKFYPAMPFVTIGCFVGYGVIRLLLF